MFKNYVKDSFFQSFIKKPVWCLDRYSIKCEGLINNFESKRIQIEFKGNSPLDINNLGKAFSSNKKLLEWINLDSKLILKQFEHIFHKIFIHKFEFNDIKEFNLHKENIKNFVNESDFLEKVWVIRLNC